MPVYYTLQIQYDSTTQPKAIEFRDLTPDGKDPNIWADELRGKLYTIGFKHTTAPGTIEFVSPLRIITAYLIKQEKKFTV